MLYRIALTPGDPAAIACTFHGKDVNSRRTVICPSITVDDMRPFALRRGIC